MSKLPPILVAELFPEVSRRLVELLRQLTPAEWHLPTVSSQRTVKDIVSHLLDGSLRRLSMQRDRFRPPDGSGAPRAGEPLMDFLNRLNAEWEVGTRRLSPQVLIELTVWADAQLAALFQSLDPHAPAIFPVAWAGEEQSANWLDIARDFTEKWHHTQQIFAATNRPSTILDRELGYRSFDIFMRALPFTFQHVAARTGTLVTVTITGAAGGSWHLTKEPTEWRQMAEAGSAPTALIEMDQETAWRLLTKRHGRETARQTFPDVRITGDHPLGSHIFAMVSVMA